MQFPVSEIINCLAKFRLESTSLLCYAAVLCVEYYLHFHTGTWLLFK